MQKRHPITFRLAAGTLACAGVFCALSAQATGSYYAVVPVSGAGAIGQLRPVKMALAGATPPAATVGVPYEFNLGALLSLDGPEGTTPDKVSWSVLSGKLPAGLALEGGRITGIPTEVSDGEVIAIHAEYPISAAPSAVQAYALRVWPSVQIGLSTTALHHAIVGDTYSASLAPLLMLDGGIGTPDPAKVQWRLTDGMLPPGLEFTENGELIGTAVDEPGLPSKFTVQVTYQQKSAEQTYQITALKAYEIATTITTETQSYNMHKAAEKSGWDGIHPLRMVVTVAPGVTVGSTSATVPALSTGMGFPEGSMLSLENNGRIVGVGGSGGSGGSGLAYGSQPMVAYPAQPGGTALQAQFPLTVKNNGTIAGGGGGGGGAATSWMNSVVADGGGGGGGQGYGTSPGGTIARYVEYGKYPYPTGSVGKPGSLTGPGQGGAGASSGMSPNQYSAPWYAKSGGGGSGGALGQPGNVSGEGWLAGSTTAIAARQGGAAGAAIEGASLVDVKTAGTLVGPTR